MSSEMGRDNTSMVKKSEAHSFQLRWALWERVKERYVVGERGAGDTVAITTQTEGIDEGESPERVWSATPVCTEPDTGWSVWAAPTLGFVLETRKEDLIRSAAGKIRIGVDMVLWTLAR